MKSTAAGASGSLDSGDCAAGLAAPRRIRASSEVSTPKVRRRTAGRSRTLIRRPGHPSSDAASRALSIPTMKSAVAPFTARLRPLVPRPASATTTTAPRRKQAYRVTVRSTPGGTIRLTRLPLPTPMSRSPASRSRMFRCSWCHVSERLTVPSGPISATAVSALAVPVANTSTESQNGRNRDGPLSAALC
ncbi:hypothetical protein PJL18_01800 [Paenarthrobacter nicotinovorans]|nr:hypothetical protein [Paenarthrobacter nicotinovorans]